MSISTDLQLTTKKMENLFIQRTKNHIRLVTQNLLKLEGFMNLQVNELYQLGINHDKSKFIEPERTAYIWITWEYYCKSKQIEFRCPDSIAVRVKHGHRHHILNNCHHPEAYDDIDSMTTLDMAEMVCDWTAISQENLDPSGSCYQWACEHVDSKWNFSKSKKDLIFNFIEELDKRNKL